MIVSVLKYGAQWGLAFAGIWTALYTSGTLEQIIPDWVGPEPVPISDDIIFFSGDSLPTTGGPPPEPDTMPVMVLVIGTVIAAALIVMSIKRLRAWA